MGTFCILVSIQKKIFSKKKNSSNTTRLGKEEFTI